MIKLGITKNGYIYTCNQLSRDQILVFAWHLNLERTQDQKTKLNCCSEEKNHFLNFFLIHSVFQLLMNKHNSKRCKFQSRFLSFVISQECKDSGCSSPSTVGRFDSSALHHWRKLELHLFFQNKYVVHWQKVLKSYSLGLMSLCSES